jgi:hypothetical protein
MAGWLGRRWVPRRRSKARVAPQNGTTPFELVLNLAIEGRRSLAAQMGWSKFSLPDLARSPTHIVVTSLNAAGINEGGDAGVRCVVADMVHSTRLMR